MASSPRATTEVGLLRPLALSLPLYGLLVLTAELLPANARALLLERGFIPHAIMVLSCWSLAMLCYKVIGLRRQRRAFVLESLVLPDGDSPITQEDAAAAIERLEMVRATRLRRRWSHSVLARRLALLLEHHAASGQAAETAALSRAEAEADAAAVASSFSMVRVFGWAIPILGFIGTVVGIGEAVGGFSVELMGSAELEAIKSSLGEVTSGLATAFDTTLVALVASVLVILPTSWLQKAEETLVHDVEDYCTTRVLRRLANPRPTPAAGFETEGFVRELLTASGSGLRDLVVAHTGLLTELAADHDAERETRKVMRAELGTLATAIGTLGPTVQGASASLEQAVLTAREATQQLGPSIAEVVARLERAVRAAEAAEPVAPAVTHAANQLADAARNSEHQQRQLSSAVARAAGQLERASELAEQTTAALGRTEDQLCRELGASRRLLELLAAGLARPAVLPVATAMGDDDPPCPTTSLPANLAEDNGGSRTTGWRHGPTRD